MQIFLTGASGFIGLKVADQLLSSGHGVTALARSDESAKQLAGKGLKVGPLSVQPLFSCQCCHLRLPPGWRLQRAHLHEFR